MIRAGSGMRATAREETAIGGNGNLSDTQNKEGLKLK
jgi:hypothetical protein